MKSDMEKQEIEDVTLDNERDFHRRIFEDDKVGIDDEKSFLHAKSWDLYMIEKIIN